MELYIKNMVCPRCIAAVEQILKEQNLPLEKIDLGYVVINKNLSEIERTALATSLQKQGFELLDDKKKQLVEQIKNIVIQEVYSPSQEFQKKNLSDILSEALQHDYKYLSTLFSDITGVTVEKFQIRHKIERVKELLVYDQLSLKEIAFLLNYSSEAYLSNQFKKITGFSPSHFKKIGRQKRISIDKL